MNMKMETQYGMSDESEAPPTLIQYRMDEDWYETLEVAFNLVLKYKLRTESNLDFGKSDFIAEVLSHWEKIPRTININSVKEFRQSTISYRPIDDISDQIPFLDFCGIKTKQYSFYADKELSISLNKIDKIRYMKIPQCMKIIIPLVLMIFDTPVLKKLRPRLRNRLTEINTTFETLETTIKTFGINTMEDYGKGYVDIRDFSNGFDFIYDFINLQCEDEEVLPHITKFLKNVTEYEMFLRIFKESPDTNFKNLFKTCEILEVNLPETVELIKNTLK